MGIISWPTPYGHTIFCDDIRREIGGKHTYVGVYTTDLILNVPPPAILSKLSMAIYYHEHKGESSDAVEVRVYMPGDQDDTPSVSALLPGGFRDEIPVIEEYAQADSIVSMIAYLNLSPIEIRQEGLIRVRAYRNDDEIRLGSLRVRYQRPQGPETSEPSI